MSLFNELKRRNVIRVAVAYMVVSWLLLQIADIVFPALRLPEWTITLVTLVLALGFIIALVFSWVYEMTPTGLMKESEIDREESVTAHTAKKLDIVIIALLIVTVGLFLSESLWRPVPQGEIVETPATLADGAPVAIAVLPFVNMSADPENEYFADGISEEILNLLAGVEHLLVASRTSAFAFKGKDTSVPDIATALGVRYVLEGSVRKAGQQVRITAQLIDASNDRHLWSQTYDRTLDDIFVMQDEIAGAIGQALQVELLGSGGHRISAEAIDPQVYERFLEARYLLRRRNAEDMARANEMLINVVAAEPDFARGHVVLAEAYLLNSDGQGDLVPRAIGEAQARVHAERARELDPGLSGVDLALGSIAASSHDMVGALRHYAHAIELEPEEPRAYHWRAIQFVQAGYLDRAGADLEVGLRLDPENANIRGVVAMTAIALGDSDRALEFARRQVTLGNELVGLLYEGVVLLYIGDPDGAESGFERMGDECGDDCRAALSAAVAFVRGELDQERLMASFSQPPVGFQRFIEMTVLLHLALDDELLDWYARNPDFRFWTAMIWSDELAETRRDPRFIHLLEEAGMTEVWRELGPPSDCRADGETFVCGYGHGGDT